MQEILNRAYNGFMGAVDSFANCSVGEEAVLPKRREAVCNSSKPDYAYPCDNYIDSVLENKLTRQTLRAIATKYYGRQIEEVTRNGSKLTEKNYPRLFSNYQDCCKTLRVTNPPKVFITSRLSGINALSVEIEKEPIVMLSYMSVVGLNDLEQKFLLGHELGHIQFGHMLVHTVQGLLDDLNKHAELLGPIVTDLVDVPLNRWYRTSEFTADRAGYLCCKDLQGIKLLFSKIDTQSPVTAFAQYKELGDAYPHITTRIEVLQEFVTLRKGRLCQ